MSQEQGRTLEQILSALHPDELSEELAGEIDGLRKNVIIGVREGYFPTQKRHGYTAKVITGRPTIPADVVDVFDEPRSFVDAKTAILAGKIRIELGNSQE